MGLNGLAAAIRPDSYWPSRHGAGSGRLVWLHPGRSEVGAGWSVALMSWEMPRSGGMSIGASAKQDECDGKWA